MRHAISVARLGTSHTKKTMRKVQRGISLLHALALSGPPGLWQQANCLLLMRMAEQKVKSNSCQSCEYCQLKSISVWNVAQQIRFLPPKSCVTRHSCATDLDLIRVLVPAQVQAILQTFVRTFRGVLSRGATVL